MPSHSLILFDDGLGRFGPLGDRRASFEFRSGALTTEERLARVLKCEREGWIAPAALMSVLNERISMLPLGALDRFATESDEIALAVNGAWLGLAHVDEIAKMSVRQAFVQPDGRLIAIRGAGNEIAAIVQAYMQSGIRDFASVLPTITNLNIRLRRTRERCLIDRPWHLLESLDAALRADIALLALPPWHDGAVHSVVKLGDHPVTVHPDARIHPMVVLNSEKGPIAIDADAVVGSFCVIAGPCYIGQETIVSPQTHIRSQACIGPQCVVGGEISQSIIHGQSNKGHAGYLGHSLVGQWVNLGADTNVSNLKNTYGSVRCQLEADGPAEDSRQSKLGPLIGDFVRTAIGTRLLTGSVVGTGAMIALSGFAPKLVPRLAFCTDEGEERYEIDKFLDTARKMMSRRGQTLSEVEADRLRALA
ncbi:MAG: putative sugar nucleotidyl transferase [Planctomycetota bacterium]|nr:putative sugar nucleotidyl transferase [Planctomycetota bacterium]